jgi:hypothetical protein
MRSRSAARPPGGSDVLSPGRLTILILLQTVDAKTYNRAPTKKGRFRILLMKPYKRILYNRILCRSMKYQWLSHKMWTNRFASIIGI